MGWSEDFELSNAIKAILSWASVILSLIWDI